MSMGNKTAIASRNKFFMHGRIAWLIKDRIDINFVKKYSNFPQMDNNLGLEKGLVDNKTKPLELMQCVAPAVAQKSQTVCSRGASSTSQYRETGNLN